MVSRSSLALYANLRIALRPTLFLTLGIRWAAQWNPQPPPASTPSLIIHPSFITSVPTQNIPSDLKQWQPRLGLAWSPTPKTTLRLSTGLYTAPTPDLWLARCFVPVRS